MKVKKPREMKLRGAAASPGIAIGRSFKHEVENIPIFRQQIKANEVEREIKRLETAVTAAQDDVRNIRDVAGKSVGRHLAKIFEAQLLILEDSEFFGQVIADIRKSHLNADYVYNRNVQRTLKSLEASEDDYLRGMSEDIKAIAVKVLGYLLGPTTKKLRDSKRRIALADNFSPGEVVLMDKYRIPGFAASRGGPTSHTVLVARSLSIPAVIGVNGLCDKCGAESEVIIDGDEGLVIVNPSEDSLTYYRSEQKRRQTTSTRQWRNFIKIPNRTRDGVRVNVCANVDFPSGTDKQLSAANVGVGLYRTEFFYLAAESFPTEEQQIEIYRGIAETFFPATVTMRVFDLGSDKMGNSRFCEGESNPALGWRGIRFDLDNQDIFRTQIRAILIASQMKNLRIMLPMISSAAEVVKARKLIRSVMAELSEEDLKYDEQIDIGIMVEVPAAALMCDTLARHVDFFSIGTNDLAQYTLAVDRGNKKLARLYRELHPAVLRLIKTTIDAADAAGKPVSLCGELARKLDAVPLLIGLGLRSFSVAPRTLPTVKRTISKLSCEECQALAERALRMSTTERVEALLRSWYADRFGKK